MAAENVKLKTQQCQSLLVPVYVSQGLHLVVLVVPCILDSTRCGEIG